eukprot:gene7088-425_t
MITKLKQCGIIITIASVVVIGSTHKQDALVKSTMLKAINNMFQHAYDSYMEHGFPHDEVLPLTCSGQDTWGPFALTLVDSLDTLYLMGNYTEFEQSAHRIINVLNFDLDKNVSVFETTIRVLGGLISSHYCAISLRDHSSGHFMVWYDRQFIDLAEELGNRLLLAFDTATGIPYGTVNLRYGVPPKETTVSSLAGAGTHLLEFLHLSALTGDSSFATASRTAMRSLYILRSSRGLWGNHIDVRTGIWTHRDSGIGPNQDSFYEYLLKGYIMTGDVEFLEMFDTAYDAINAYMKKGDWYVDVNMRTGQPSLLWFTALSAFWPGLQVLYGHVAAAERTLLNFFSIWRSFGFVPEVFDLRTGRVHPTQAMYPLRPEMAESLWYISSATRDDHWQSLGLNILGAINTSAAASCGYTTIANVSDHRQSNRMESFFLSETLKYLFLLVNGTSPPMKQEPFHRGFVFNTEAHPLPLLSIDSHQPLPWQSNVMDLAITFFVHVVACLSSKNMAVRQKVALWPSLVLPIPEQVDTPLFERSKSLFGEGKVEFTKQTNYFQKHPPSWYIRRSILWDTCISFKTQPWLYDFCFGKTVIRYRIENNSRTQRTVLGVRNLREITRNGSSLSHLERLVGRPLAEFPSPRETVTDNLNSGDPCNENGKQHSVQVTYSCVDNTKIEHATVSIEILSDCKHQVRISTPLMCT